MTQKPYVGAVVHYREQNRFADHHPKAAIIVDVHDDNWVALFIISNGGGTRFASHVEHGVGWEWITAPAEVHAPSSGWDSLS